VHPAVVRELQPQLHHHRWIHGRGTDVRAGHVKCADPWIDVREFLLRSNTWDRGPAKRARERGERRISGADRIRAIFGSMARVFMSVARIQRQLGAPTGSATTSRARLLWKSGRRPAGRGVAGRRFPGAGRLGPAHAKRWRGFYDETGWLHGPHLLGRFPARTMFRFAANAPRAPWRARMCK
jgi:hypothetical protein